MTLFLPFLINIDICFDGDIAKYWHNIQTEQTKNRKSEIVLIPKMCDYIIRVSMVNVIMCVL